MNLKKKVRQASRGTDLEQKENNKKTQDTTNKSEYQVTSKRTRLHI